MGLKITAEWLSLFNEEKGDPFYEMVDMIDRNGEVVGTKVILKINHKPLMEEVA